MRHCSKLHRPRAGFTLLETLVVLTLVGLIAGVAAPLLRAPAERLRLESATRSFCAALRASRARAIANNAETIVVIDVVNKTYNSPVIRNGRFPLDASIQIEVANTRYFGENLGTIVFFPDGASTGGDITLKLPKSNAKISVNWLTGGAKCVFG